MHVSRDSPFLSFSHSLFLPSLCNSLSESGGRVLMKKGRSCAVDIKSTRPGPAALPQIAQSDFPLQRDWLAPRVKFPSSSASHTVPLPYDANPLGCFPQKVLITIYVRRVCGLYAVLAFTRLFGAHVRALSLVAFCGNNPCDPGPEMFCHALALSRSMLCNNSKKKVFLKKLQIVLSFGHLCRKFRKCIRDSSKS